MQKASTTLQQKGLISYDPENKKLEVHFFSKIDKIDNCVPMEIEVLKEVKNLHNQDSERKQSTSCSRR